MTTLVVLLAACTASPASSPAPPPVTPTATATSAPTASPEPPPEPATVVMWARGGLPADVASRARTLPGVLAALHVRSDTLGLVGTRDAEGRPVDTLEPGWRIPVEVIAVDPALADALPAGATRDAVADLQPGQALLTETAAELRRIGAGGQVDLAGRPGLQVAAVIPDGEIGRDEVVVHAADADAVGLEATGSLRVLHDGTDGEALAAGLEALAPADTSVRVVGATEDEPARRTPLVLSLPDVKARFGEFAFRDEDADREVQQEVAWVTEHIVVAEVPLLGRVRCHEAIIDDLRAALQAVEDAGLGGEIDPDLYGGCYHPRRIGEGSSLSRHSWGIAIDINVDISLPGLGPEPSPEVVEAFAANGFRWGGLFLSPDNHHFEWVGEAALESPPRARVRDTGA